MTKQQFFEAFVAALRAQGETAVITERDLHHANFARALSVLAEARSANRPGSEALPKGLVGDEITGRFPELDFALSNLQFSKHAGASNPTYRRVDLKLAPATAKKILDLYPSPQRALIEQIAGEFAQTSGATVHQ